MQALEYFFVFLRVEENFERDDHSNQSHRIGSLRTKEWISITSSKMFR